MTRAHLASDASSARSAWVGIRARLEFRLAERLSRRIARLLAAGFSAACLLGSSMAEARDGCRSTSENVVVDREGAKRRAVTLAHEGRLDEARGLLLGVLAAHPDDAEARAWLARTDAWGGCLELAESGYREVLDRYPNDADVRLGLIDVLTWQGRYDEAEAETDRALRGAPKYADLWLRKARLRRMRGDWPAARKAIRHAEALGPLDADGRALDAGTYLGEARLGARADFFPEGFSDIHTVRAHLTQRLGRVRIGLDQTWLERQGGLTGSAVMDGQRTLTLDHTFRNGGEAGVSIGHAAPARVLPRWALGLRMQSPIVSWLSAGTGYHYWRYADDKAVHLFDPWLTFDVVQRLSITPRAWIAYVSSENDSASFESQTVLSAGGRVAYAVRDEWNLGAEYVYGAQLDRNPALFQLTELRSHIATLFTDVRIRPDLGLRPLLAYEWRRWGAGNRIGVPSVGLDVYVRW